MFKGNFPKVILVVENTSKRWKAFLKSLFVVLVFVSLSSVPAYSAINQQINYQAKLTDSGGSAVTDDDYSVVFSLYTASTGGSAIWTETQTVSTESGLFSVMLGSVSTLSSVDFNQTLYLGINVEADGEMSPRKILGAVPASFEAKQLEGLTSSQFLRSDTNNDDATFTNSTSTNATSTTLAVSGTFNFLGTAITNVSTWFNGLFDTQLGTKDSDDLTEGATNFYFTTDRLASGLQATTTDALAEGSTNLYYTDTRARASISESITGIDYDNGTGAFSLTADYSIPLTASTTNWNAFYDTPSSRITAGTGLSWSSNTLNAEVQSSDLSAYLLNTGDTATGDYTFDTDTFFIDSSSDRIGIGTTTPSYKLEVYGASDPTIAVSDSTNHVVVGMNASDTYGLFGTLTDHSLFLVQNSSVALTVDTDANVGIGTTTPTGKLSVDLDNTDTTNTNGAGSIIKLSNPNASGQNVIYSEINGTLVSKWRTDYLGGTNWISNGANSFHTFYTGGDYGVGDARLILFNNGAVALGGAMEDQNNFSGARMYIDDAGLVGIATNDPQARLDVLRANNAMTYTVTPNQMAIVGASGNESFDLTSSYIDAGANPRIGGLFVSNTETGSNEPNIGVVGIGNPRGGSVLANGYGGVFSAVSGNAAATNYGLYVKNVSGGASNYGIYVEPSVDNYFAGSVGIGTSTPAAALDIYGASSAGMQLTDGNGTTFSLSSGGVANNSFAIRDVTDSAWRFVIDTNGRVGMGTTTPVTDLSVQGSGGSTYGGINIYDSADDDFAALDPNHGVILRRNVGYVSNSYIAGDLRFRTSVSSAYDTTSLSLDGATGYVGIGTDDPDTLLQIRESTTNTSTAGMYITQASTGDSVLHYELEGTRFFSTGIDNSDSDKFKISHSSSLGTNDFLTITTAGLVGIGTSNPAYTFNVDDGGSDLDPTVSIVGRRRGSSYNNSALIFSAPRNDTADGNSAGGRGMITLPGTSSTSHARLFLNANTSSLDPSASEATLEGYQSGLEVNSQAYVDFWASGTNYARIHSNGSSYFNGGNFGVGVSPSQRFHVYQNVAGSVRFRIQNSENYFDVITDNSDFAVLDSGGTNRFHIENGGNIGIGTSGPSYKLEVSTGTVSANTIVGSFTGATSDANEQILLEVENTATNGLSMFQATGGTASAWFGVNSNARSVNPGDAFIVNTTNNDIIFSTSTAEIARFKTAESGGLAIGGDHTLASDAKLGLRGTAPVVQFTETDQTGSWYAGVSGDSFYITESGSIGIKGGLSDIRFRVDSSGNAYTGNMATSGTQGACWANSATNQEQLVDCSGAPSDLAEWYETDGSVSEGDIVMVTDNLFEYKGAEANPFDYTVEDEVKDRSLSVLTKATDTAKVIGIISSDPYQVMGEEIKDQGRHPLPVALSGRVPVKVNLDGGNISPGDQITLSDTPGVGKKSASNEDVIVGIALDRFNDSSPKTGGVGQVMIMTNLRPARLSSPDLNNLTALQTDPESNIAYSLMNLNGHSITNVKAIESLSNSWSISADGVLTVKKLRTDSLEVGEGKLNSGVTLFDRNNGKPYCVFVKNGVIKTEDGRCGENESENSNDQESSGSSSGGGSGSSENSSDDVSSENNEEENNENEEAQGEDTEGEVSDNETVIEGDSQNQEETTEENETNQEEVIEESPEETPPENPTEEVVESEPEQTEAAPEPENTNEPETPEPEATESEPEASENSSGE